MPKPDVAARYSAALDALVGQIRQDRSILAAILCGSLSHDVVWEKSDIDLMLITVEDEKIGTTRRSDIPLYADGVNVHAGLMSRTELRKVVDGALHQSFIHSLLAKGRLLYTHDDTIADLFRRLQDIGARDSGIQLLGAATHALAAIDKARKWLVTRGDLEYAALWILYAATPLAQIEVISRRRLADREVIPQALALNPGFFKMIYADLLNTKKTRANVQGALDAVDAYVAERAPVLFKPVLDHLRDVGEARSTRELDDHFTRHFNIPSVTSACEYLADRHLLGKASSPARLTRRSNIDVQELAFFFLGPA